MTEIRTPEQLGKLLAEQCPLDLVLAGGDYRSRHEAVVARMMPVLRMRRYQRHFSQAGLAAMLGVSRGLIERCDRGAEIPSPKLFYRWRDLLGC